MPHGYVSLFTLSFSALLHNDPAAHQDHCRRCRIRARHLFPRSLLDPDKVKTKIDDVYGETVKDGVKFLPPVEFNAYIAIAAPENKFLGSTKMDQLEPGNITMSVYLKTLEDLEIDIQFGDYVGYYDSENFVRYYTVVNDGRVISDTKHSYKGFKPFFRTIIAAPVGPNEFKGL